MAPIISALFLLVVACGGGDEEREGHRLAGARFAAEQQVPLRQRHLDRVSVLADPDGDRIPEARSGSFGVRPREG